MVSTIHYIVMLPESRPHLAGHGLHRIPGDEA